MSETHSLAVRIEHHDPSAYMALAVDVRRSVEVALLNQIAAQIPLTVQDQWLDPANLDIQPVTVNGVTSFTLSAIDDLFNKVLSDIGPQLTVSTTLHTSCRHCEPYHCDRVCRGLLLNGLAWVVSMEIIPGDESTRMSATAALEFEFPAIS